MVCKDCVAARRVTGRKESEMTTTTEAAPAAALVGTAGATEGAAKGGGGCVASAVALEVDAEQALLEPEVLVGSDSGRSRFLQVCVRVRVCVFSYLASTALHNRLINEKTSVVAGKAKTQHAS